MWRKGKEHSKGGNYMSCGRGRKSQGFFGGREKME